MSNKKGVIVWVGDSLSTGFNSEAGTSSGPFGPLNLDEVRIYDRWLDLNVNQRIGLSSDTTVYGWSPLRYDDSNWQRHGPIPAYYVAGAIVRFLNLDELRVIGMGVPATDVTQSPPQGNNQISWYPGIAADGLYDRFRDTYITPAKATSEVTSDHLYLGTFASLGNNMNNADVYTVDSTLDLKENLELLFSSIESELILPGTTSSQVVTQISSSLDQIGQYVDIPRLNNCYDQLELWKNESVGGPNYRATADLTDISYRPNDPHYSAESTLEMGKRLFQAWLSSTPAGSAFPTVDLS